jgi:hypothetical protein
MKNFKFDIMSWMIVFLCFCFRFVPVAIFVVFVCGISYELYNRPKMTEKRNQKRVSEIYSLKNTDRLHGSFVLGIGSVGTSEYYVFFRKTAKGGLVRESMDVADCVLYEDSVVPKIVEYGTLTEWQEDGKVTKTRFDSGDVDTSILHEIHIPKGTITERYNLDLN